MLAGVDEEALARVRTAGEVADVGKWESDMVLLVSALGWQRSQMETLMLSLMAKSLII